MNKLITKQRSHRPLYKAGFSMPNESFASGGNLILLGLLPILATILLTITIFSLSGLLPNKVPLFFSLTWGDKQLADKHQLLIIPASLAILTLLNLSFFWKLSQTKDLLRKILVYSSLITTTVLMITFLRIILIFI